MLTLLSAAILSACGGGHDDEPGDLKFASMVTFGDSLADIGSYNVGTIQALGGGKFTINGDNTKLAATLTGKNWTELMAEKFKLAAPCAAQTGLTGSAELGLSVPIVNHAGCTSYAQGGARVTAPVGPGNALLGSPLGALTVPVVTQVQNHLATAGGAFKGNEVVLVMAGGNDTFFQLSALTDPANGAAAVAAMATAGTELVALVKTQMLAKGAKYVVVNNLPDVATTPFGRAQPAAVQSLIGAMVDAFNAALKSGLASENRVLLIDVYGLSHDEAINPASYGLTNVTDPACDLSPAKNLLSSSLICNGSNLKAGDVSHYAFADDVHPTPYYGYLLAKHIAEKLAAKTWR